MKSPNIKINWIFNVVNEMISCIIPLLVTPYVSRIFGADGIGINSYTTANVTYFTLFCMLGIRGYGRRVIAISRDNQSETSKLFWELFILHGITSLLTLVLYGVLIVCSDKYRIFYIVNLITVLASIIDFNWFLEAYERFRTISIRNCILKILTVVLTFLLIHTKDDLALYIGIHAMSKFLTNFSLFFEVRKYVIFVNIKELHWFRHMKEVVVYFVPTIAASVYSILDKSVINWITGSDAENGYYEQAYKLLLIVNTFVHSLETVLAPRMSNLFVNETIEKFRERLNEALQIMLLLAMPCAFGLMAVAPTLIPVFFGNGFDKVISITYLFVPLVLVLGLSVYLDGLYLVPSGQRGKSAVAVCIGAVLNLWLNIIFIIKWQSFGAAAATLITEMVVSGIMIFLSRKMIDWRLIITAAIRYGVVSLGMFVIVRCVSGIAMSDIKSLLLQIATGVGVYMLYLLCERDSLVRKIVKNIM